MYKRGALFSAAAIGLAGLLGLTACAGSGTAVPGEGTVVHIGMSGPYTGPSAAFGPTVETGLKQGFSDYAEGSNIDVTTQDDGCSPENAATVVQGMLTKGVRAIFGPVCSGALMATQQMMADSEIPHISGGYQASLTETGDEFYLRTVPNDTQLTDVMTHYIADQGYKSIGVVHDSTSYGKSGANSFESNAGGAGLSIAYMGEYPYGSTDYSGQVVRLRDAKPDAIYLQGYEADLGQLVRAIRQLGLTQPIFGPTVMGNKEFAEAAGAAGNGVIFTSNYIAGNPETADFAQQFEKKTGQHIMDVTAAGYLGGVALAEAFKTVGDSPSGPDLMKALRAVDVETPLGRVKFDENGDLTHPHVLIGTIKDGAAELVQDVSK